MLGSRKELIKEYNEGKTTDKLIYSPDQYDSYVLVKWDNENAFGYHKHYSSNEKYFFKVKVSAIGNDISFKKDGDTFKLSQFKPV